MSPVGTAEAKGVTHGHLQLLLSNVHMHIICLYPERHSHLQQHIIIGLCTAPFHNQSSYSLEIILEGLCSLVCRQLFHACISKDGKLTGEVVDGLHAAHPIWVPTKHSQPLLTGLAFMQAQYKQCLILAPAQTHQLPLSAGPLLYANCVCTCDL